LNPRYYGPYQINEKVGIVAYKLKLPEGSSIYLAFHVSLLKNKIVEEGVVSSTLLVMDESGRIRICPVAILDKKLMKKTTKLRSED
jgi:hypothetical protein